MTEEEKFLHDLSNKLAILKGLVLMNKINPSEEQSEKLDKTTDDIIKLTTERKENLKNS